MKKILFCDIDLLNNAFASPYSSYLEKCHNSFLEYANHLCKDEEINIYFFCKSLRRIRYTANFFKTRGYINFKYKLRTDVKKFVLQYKNSNTLFIFISGKDADLNLATKTKSLFIVPTWIPTEKKTENYGTCVNTPFQLFKHIMTLQ